MARLAAGDETVGQLAAPYDVGLQAVSKHLKVLEDAGLVTRSRDAQRRPVHLEAQVFELMTAWIEHCRRAAEQRYRRLDAVLAEADPTVPVIRITRDFAATPAQVLRAHTDPERFARWVGPDSVTTRIDHWDARSGGSWAFSNLRGRTSSGSGARSTRSGRTGSSRRSPTSKPFVISTYQ